jgi:hypothetical protein
MILTSQWQFMGYSPIVQVMLRIVSIKPQAILMGDGSSLAVDGAPRIP